MSSEPSNRRPPSVSLPPLTQGERRQVTIWMADLCGYTGLNEAFDPEQVAEVMDRIEGEATRIVAEHDGIVNQFVGDEIVALFGVPTAHEDDPQRAVSSALELHRYVRKLGDELGKRLPNLLRLHTGVHSGLVLAKLHDPRHGLYNLRGDTINVAARLRSIATPDQIIVSQATQTHVAPFFSSEPLESFVLRGRAEPVTAYRIVAPTKATTAFEAAQKDSLVRLAGRTPELEAMSRGFQRVREGRGQFFAIAGHAGVGKSRLLYEFRRRVEGSATVLSTRCEAYGKITPYQAFLHPVRQALGLIEPRSDSPNTVIEASLVALGLEEYRRVFASMLSVTADGAPSARGEELRALILRALVDLFIALTKRGPVVLLLEDWHSADEGSSTAVSYLAQSIAGHPIFLAVTHRPTESIVWPSPPDETIDLSPLDSQETAQVASSILGADIPGWLVSAIHEHTGGNALFIEEVCRALVETGWHWAAFDFDTAGRRVRLPMPSTVQAVLRARIDSLQSTDADILRFASVLGPEFSIERLRLLLVGSDRDADDLEACMRRLISADLIYPEIDRGPSVYRFKHAITQEVAYETLLRQRRRELHAQAARAIEQTDASVFDEHCEALAYHYGLGEEFERAALFAEQAGDRAARTFSLEEARQQYRQAVTCLDRLEATPEVARRRVDVGLKWAAACMFKPAAEQLEVLQVSLEHAERTGYKRGVAYTLCWSGCIEYALGHQDKAAAAFTACMPLAAEMGDERLTAQLHVNLGQSYAAATDYPAALEHLSDGLEKKERVPSGRGRESSRGVPSGFGRAYGLGYLGLVFGDRGQFDLAYAHIDQALSIVQVTRGRAIEGSILTQLAMVQLWQGDWDGCQRTALLMQGTAEKVHGPYILAMSKTVGGYAKFATGRQEEGLDLLRAAAAWLEATNIGLTLSWNLACLAEALALASHVDEARTVAERALARSTARDLLGEAAALRALGLAEARGRGTWSSAEAYFERALSASARKGSDRDAAMTRLRGATVALRFEEKSRAADWLRTATDQFAAMKMDAYLAEARALARPLAEDVARAPT